jgi:hypothetical protein
MTAPMAPAVQTSPSEWLFVDFFVPFFGFGGGFLWSRSSS